MELPASSPASLLQHRPFVLYWNARIFASLAFQMVGVSVAWQMYLITGSAFDLGLVGLVQFLPATVLILVAGQLADRYDRRLILQLCQGVEGAAAAALAYGSFTGSISKQFILVAVFFLGAGRAFEFDHQPGTAPRCGACRVAAARGRSLLGHDASRHHLGPGDRRHPLRGEPDLRVLESAPRCSCAQRCSSPCCDCHLLRRRDRR